MKILVLLSLLAFGCSAAEVDPAPDFDLDRFVVAPSSELQGVVQTQIDRLAAATGVEVRIDPAGVPLLFADVVQNDKGQDICGKTLQFVDEDFRILGAHSIGIRSADGGQYTGPPIRCSSTPSIVLHELLHTVMLSQSHALGGVLIEDSSDPLLSETTLELVCQHVDCHTFAPETR